MSRPLNEKDLKQFETHPAYDWRDVDPCDPNRNSIYNQCDLRESYAAMQRCEYCKVDDIYIRERNNDPCPIMPSEIREAAKDERLKYISYFYYRLSCGDRIAKPKNMKWEHCINVLDYDDEYSSREDNWKTFIRGIVFFGTLSSAVFISNYADSLLIILPLAWLLFGILYFVPVWEITFSAEFKEHIRYRAMDFAWLDRENKRRRALYKRNAKRFGLKRLPWYDTVPYIETMGKLEMEREWKKKLSKFNNE